MVANFSAKHFTGGRYHAWLVAEALAEAGHHVCVETKETPIVAKECVDFPSHNKIELLIDPNFKV